MVNLDNDEESLRNGNMRRDIYFYLLCLVIAIFFSQSCLAGQGGNYERFKHRHDTNGDGQITREEFNGPAGAFRRLDQDENNIVTKEEFEKTWKVRQRHSRNQLGINSEADKQYGRGRQIPPGVKVHRDLEYARVDGESLHLDLYLPENMDAHTPLLVWIHGGGWTRGDKALINPAAIRLSGEGYAVASINYRLVGLNLHPKQIHDCKGAIRWLRSKAHHYGYDATRIGVGGGSAGAHLALLLGLSAGEDELEGMVGGNLNESSQVHAVVDLFGPSALLSYADEVPDFRGKKSSALLWSASPVRYLTSDDPPVLIFHGDEDSIVPVSQSRILHERYRQVGLDSTLHIIEGAAHGGMEYSDSIRYPLIKEFFDKHIKRLDEYSNLKVKPSPSAQVNTTNSTEYKQQNFVLNKQNAKLHGFHWMIGPKSGLAGSEDEFQRLLMEIDRNLSSNPYITGVYIITHWRLIEPKENQLDLSRLDRVIEIIRKQGRYYKLSVNPGIYTPEWVYELGAEAFNTLGSNPDRREIYNKKTKVPIPWDPVFLDQYFKTLGAIAERYRDDASFRAIALTVATFMSPEWHLPNSRKDKVQWQALIGFPGKLEQVWKEGIDRFANLFPKQYLILEASSYPVGLKTLGDAVVDYGVSKYGGRFAVQINQLSGRYDQSNRPTFQKLLSYRKEYGSQMLIGLQNVKGWGISRIAKKQGGMEMTAFNFIQADGDYWELWYHDGKTKKTVEALYNLKMDGIEIGLDDFKEKLINAKKYKPTEKPINHKK